MLRNVIKVFSELRTATNTTVLIDKIQMKNVYPCKPQISMMAVDVVFHQHAGVTT